MIWKMFKAFQFLPVTPSLVSCRAYLQIRHSPVNSSRSPGRDAKQVQRVGSQGLKALQARLLSGKES